MNKGKRPQKLDAYLREKAKERTRAKKKREEENRKILDKLLNTPVQEIEEPLDTGRKVVVELSDGMLVRRVIDPLERDGLEVNVANPGGGALSGAFYLPSQFIDCICQEFIEGARIEVEDQTEYARRLRASSPLILISALLTRFRRHFWKWKPY